MPGAARRLIPDSVVTAVLEVTGVPTAPLAAGAMMQQEAAITPTQLMELTAVEAVALATLYQATATSLGWRLAHASVRFLNRTQYEYHVYV